MNATLAVRLPDYFYFVFAVCAIVSACIVLFYAKRHPNPHFRPRKSDVTIVSFVMLFLSGGIAFVTSGAFDNADMTREKLEKQAEDAERVARMAGKSVEEELDLVEGDGAAAGGDGAATGPTDSFGNPLIPEDVPDELREVLGGGS